MRKNAGFSIVELVIVIAVIAILAAILIPVYANVAGKAKESEMFQNARNMYTRYATDHAQDTDVVTNFIYVDDGKYVIVKNGAVIAEIYPSQEAALKALLDDPDTPADESVDSKVEATAYDKLFACTLKTRA